MPKSITPGQIKKTNRQQIYSYIYEHKTVSQQDLTCALRLSRPTVASNLAEMEETGLTTQALSRYLPYPCSFVHDPDAAALSELWSSPNLTDAIYLSLSRHLGGSMIVKRNIVPGKHGHTATFEHIQARPRGKLCYCGKRGCMETICSMQALLGDDDPEDFFQLVRGGAPEQAKRWQDYLKNLAGLIGMLHLVHDVDFILGGHLAPYFTQSDLRLIYDEIRRGCPFDDSDDYLLISKMPSHNINIGVALPYIQAFLADIGQQAGNPSSGFRAEV